MSFRTRPSTHRISTAPTGRAKCRKCKQCIPKGAVRLETCAFVRPNRRTVFVRCGGCVDAKMAAAVLSVYKVAERVPVDESVSECDVVRVRGLISKGR